MSAKRVVIVGGGLAGMAAAVALEASGANVTLLEARRMLGGRAGSFEDPQTGETLDNCQHVLLGCCTNLIDFYQRMGVSGKIRWENDIYFRDATGRRHDLGGIAGFPAPLNLGPALLKFAALSWSEKLALTRAMLAMADLGRAGRDTLDDLSFGQWLDQHNQPASLVKTLYDPIVISGLNENTRDASASAAIHIFQDSLLANNRGNRLGLPICPLSELYGKMPCADVRLGARVARIDFTGGKAAGVTLQTGQALPADAVILATNFHGVRKWIPEALLSRDARFAHLDKLSSVPILGVHLWFDRKVIDESHSAFIEGPLQWVFRKDSSGTSVHGVISAAREWADCDRDRALAQFEAQVRSTLPLARQAKLQRGVIVVEKRATFTPLPGTDRLRPQQAPTAGGIENLLLAGDYTRTGWPATMEGAVRSGYYAAEALTKQRFVVDDLPIQWPARLLGM